MNTAIKRDRKQTDQFALTTESGLQWARSNQQSSLLVGGIAVLLILGISIGYSTYQHRVTEAQTAFGQAMQIYQTPVAPQDRPVPPGVKTFPTVAARAAQANPQFADVARRFGMTEPGKLAQYLTGVTFLEEGQTGAAEDALKKAASSWNGDSAALAKLALAQLYVQTHRDDQAIGLYQQLTKTNATTVPAGLAELQRAALYTSEGKTEEARQIYATLKDHDKGANGKPGVAAQVASDKLNPQPAASGAPAR